MNKDLKTTQIYAKIVDEVREMHMNKWDLESEILTVEQPKTINMIEKENEQLKKRIAELEAMLKHQPVLHIAR